MSGQSIGTCINSYKNMVVCSTLNQMVNYIPVMKHKPEKVFILTASEQNHKFDQEKWNKNLKNVLPEKIEIEPIVYSVNEMTEVNNIVSFLQNKQIPGPTIWNITGGQRYLIIGILKFLQQQERDDIILYFDGDLGRFYYYNRDLNFICQKGINDPAFGNCPLDIETALELMGFERRRNKKQEEPDEIRKIMADPGKDRFDKFKEHLKASKKYKLYQRIYEECSGDSTVAYIFLASNNNNLIDNYPDPKPSGTDEEYKKEKRLHFIIDFLKKANKLEKVFPNGSLELLRKDMGEKLKGYVFGYILEKMAYYQILAKLKQEKSFFDAIADIALDYSICKDDNNMSVDQFDMLLLTRTGQLAVFECKSGDMSGDVAKSTHYSTYAVSGVYGKPILVVPSIKIYQVDNDIKSKINERAGEKIDIAEEIGSKLNSIKTKAEKAGLTVKELGEIGSAVEVILG